MARRVVLHIGAMKSGTSFVQNVATANREALLEQGVLFAGTRWRDQVDAVRDVAQRSGRHLAPDGPWNTLVREIAAWDGTALISMEFLAARTPEEIAFICSSFGDAEVSVILTARDLGRTVPAMWLESTQNGATETWEEFLDQVRRAEGRAGRDFHRHQDLPALAQRWSAVVGRDNFTIITVPQPGASPRVLWERFASVLGIDGSQADLEVRANLGLGLASALVLRRFNEKYLAAGGEGKPGDPGRDYQRLVKHRLAKSGLVHREGEPKLGFDTRWGRRMGAQQIEALRVAGYRVVGDLDELTPQRVVGVQPKQVSGQDQLEAALDGLLFLVGDLTERSARRRARQQS